MALTKAKLIADNAVKAVHIDETDTGITLAQLNVTGDITTSSGTITASAFVGDGSGITGVSSDYTVSEISTNTTAVANNLYVLTASLTLTLPASPSVGDKVAVSNMSGTTTPVVARNGSLILGLAEDLTINVENISVEFIYSGATEGWVVFTDSILGYASVDTIDGSGTTNYVSKWSAADTLTDSAIFESGGSVGIGTTSVSSFYSGGNQLVVGNGTGQQGMTIYAGTSNDSGIYFADGTVNNGPFEGQLVYRHSNDAFIFYTSAAVRARLDSDGLKFNGDTAAANALDDYEEGTFTATLEPGTSGTINLSTSFNTCAYTKIGRVVTISGLIRVSSTSSPVGSNFYISNLPFTSANAFYARSSSSIVFQDASAGYPTSKLSGWVVSNDTRVVAFRDASTVAADDYIILSATYIV